MNKQLNTVLFTIGATIFNLITMGILIIVPLILIAVIFKGRLGPSALPIIGLVLFFGALIANFFIYGWVMRKISAKYDLNKYFEPLFKKKEKNQ
jgi:hypothetical protein